MEGMLESPSSRRSVPEEFEMQHCITENQWIGALLGEQRLYKEG